MLRVMLILASVFAAFWCVTTMPQCALSETISGATLDGDQIWTLRMYDSCCVNQRGEEDCDWPEMSATFPVTISGNGISGVIRVFEPVSEEIFYCEPHDCVPTFNLVGSIDGNHVTFSFDGGIFFSARLEWEGLTWTEHERNFSSYTCSGVISGNSITGSCSGITEIELECVSLQQLPFECAGSTNNCSHSFTVTMSGSLPSEDLPAKLVRLVGELEQMNDPAINRAIEAARTLDNEGELVDISSLPKRIDAYTDAITGEIYIDDDFLGTSSDRLVKTILLHEFRHAWQIAILGFEIGGLPHGVSRSNDTDGDLLPNSIPPSASQYGFDALRDLNPYSPEPLDPESNWSMFDNDVRGKLERDAFLFPLSYHFP